MPLCEDQGNRMRYPDGKLVIFHGLRKIARYDEAGQKIKIK